MEEKRICKRCLLRDMDKDVYYKDMKEYIESLDEEVKADSALYESRLQKCSNCDYLNAGLCRACGCYVEMRAAVTNNSCPYERW